jgi:4-amino-4-deoxy-L-arabinose transferase-like glycosyltransferase
VEQAKNRVSVENAMLAAILAVAALLRLWRIEELGFGTTYYAAAVRSMMQSAWLFFYNAFDPGGFISVDKPPVAFWVQTIFAKLLGYSGWTLHLPQALAGTASVAIVHRLVRKPFGPSAALIAAFALAITPIAVAIDRSNNTDSWLVLFLLLAAWAALRGQGLSLVLAMALLGMAFNVKMLAALVCGPAVLVGWLMASTTLDWRKRLRWMVGAGTALVVVSLAWVAAFDLTPKEMRPYAGSSKSNSMLELVFQHNGAERFALSTTTSANVTYLRFPLYDNVPIGPLRLAEPRLAAQFAWLLPLAVAGLLLMRRRDRFDPSLALWGVWAITYAIVFSAAGGIFHLYYLATLGPPFAALAGIGCMRLWRRGPSWLALGLGLTALWQAYVSGASLGWSSTWLGFPAVALLAAAATLWRGKRPPAAVGGLALLALPAAWAVSTIYSPGNLTLPSASLPRALGLDDGRGPILSRDWPVLTEDAKLAEFLIAHRSQARFIAATPTTLLAAPLIIRTGLPVMAVGGYLGGDPTITMDQLSAMVGKGEVRYAVLGGFGRGRAMMNWVRNHSRYIDDAEWRSLPVPLEPSRTLTVYELKP